MGLQDKKEFTYSEAGVDREQVSKILRDLKGKIRTTFNSRVLKDIGAFAGFYSLDPKEYRSPVLVSSMDGVGTKLKVAVMMNRHTTIGKDLVFHCVNDIAVHGAQSLFFLDYIAMGKLIPKVIEEIGEGLVAGCREAGCVLIGGETAEMPGVYQAGEYDLVGTMVGIVEQDKIIDGSKILPGDCLLGLASNGLHTNGYSLVRKLLFEEGKFSVNDYLPELNSTMGEELLRVHRNYGNIIHRLLSQYPIRGMAHITGGGITENLVRILPSGCRAVIYRGSWEIFPIFQLLQRLGNLSWGEMARTFNLGVGMVLVVPAEEIESVREELKRAKEKCWVIGEITSGISAVEYK
jgi:phosphoribosylformylglycinamidine cyclo-ligase